MADEIFVRLRTMDTKNEQDIFLQSLINSQDVQTHRPRKKGEEARPPREQSFTYHVMVGDQKERVCLNAFKSLYGIKISRIRRLRTLLLAGKSPKDLRGKKLGTNAIPAATRLLIREHVERFPLKESKYAGKVIKYLDARLNIKLIYNMFIEKHPGIKCSYKFFVGFFMENFNYRFGRPQIDCCCTCEELGLKLRSPHLSDAAKRNVAAELMVHRRASKKFYNKLQSYAKYKHTQTDILAVAFDYMQNIPLPIIPVQETFYLRQLTVNVFCIHNIIENKAQLYIYHEGTARKSPDEVCSFVYEYLTSVPNHIKEVHVFSDNCGGQNKNHTLNRVFLALTDSGRFRKIEQYYPIRGHSYLPCDRNFALITRKLRKNDRLYTIHQLTELIVTSSSSNKFTVKEVDNSEILNFKKWWQAYYKKTCVSEETRGKRVRKEDKVFFGISSIMHFTYVNTVKGSILARPNIDGLVVHTFKLSHSADQVIVFPSVVAYESGKISIKQQKLDDVRALLPYIPQDNEGIQEFYKELMEWPTGEKSDGEEVHDII